MSKTNIRDDLIVCVDDARAVVDDCGLRQHDMKVRTRTWAGTQAGDGVVTETDITLTPRPRLRLPENEQWLNPAGEYEQGDLLIDRVSARYTRAELGDPEAVSAGNIEAYWVITERGSVTPEEELYDVVSTEKQNFQWRVHLRRKRPR